MQELLKYLNIELSESSRKDPFLFWRLVFIKTVLLMTLVPLVITIIDFFDKTNIQTRAVASGLIAINLFIFTIVQKPSEAKLASRYIALLIILPNFIAPFVLEAGAADPSFINQSGNILLSVILLGFNKSYLLGAAFFIYNLIGATGILDPYMIGRGYLSLDDGIVFVRNYSICLVLAGLYFIEKIYTDFVKKITKEKMDEQKLENQEVLNKVAAGFAHELNNPLAIIDGYVNFLRVTQRDSDGKQYGALKGIEDSATRIGVTLQKFISIYSTKKASLSHVRVKDAIEQSLVKDNLSQMFEINLDNRIEALVESKMFSHVIYLVSINAYEAIYKKIDSDKKFEPKLFWEVTGDRTLSCVDNGDGFEGVNFEDACRPFVTSKFGKEGRGLGLFTITYLCDKLGIEISYKRMGELTFIDLTFPNSFIYRLESKKDVA